MLALVNGIGAVKSPYPSWVLRLVNGMDDVESSRMSKLNSLLGYTVLLSNLMDVVNAPKPMRVTCQWNGCCEVT